MIINLTNSKNKTCKMSKTPKHTVFVLNKNIVSNIHQNTYIICTDIALGSSRTIFTFNLPIINQSIRLIL